MQFKKSRITLAFLMLAVLSVFISNSCSSQKEAVTDQPLTKDALIATDVPPTVTISSQPIDTQASSTGTPTPAPSETPNATPTNTAIVWPTSTPINGPFVIIRGVDKQAEFADLTNIGNEPQDLTGWILRSERGSQDCELGGTIQADQTLRVYALASDSELGGFNCGFDDAIWNNSGSDPAVLFNKAGEEVDRW